MKKQTFALTFILLSPSISVFAQDTLNTPKTLEEVVVSFQADKLSPITFDNLSKATLKKIALGQEPSQVFAETPSITAYTESGLSQGYSYIRMRGIDQTRINFTLDGVPISEPEDQGCFLANFPDILASVNKVQIQRGVGTSKNGTGSYAGSVQLFSPNLRDSTYTNFMLGYGSYNTFRVMAEYNSGINNNKALYVRLSHTQSDGYKYNSDNKGQSININTGLFYDKAEWKLNIIAGRQDNGLSWMAVDKSLIEQDKRTNANINERDKPFQTIIQLQNKWKIAPHHTLQTTLYDIYAFGDYDFNENAYYGLPITDQLFTYSFESNVIGAFSNYTYQKNNLTWTSGLHVNHYKKTHEGRDNYLGPQYSNYGLSNELSAFSKIDYNLNKWNLFTDVQYRYRQFQYHGDAVFPTMNWNFINPKAGLSYNTSNHIFYYSIGQTKREPTRSDLFYGMDNLMKDSSGNSVYSDYQPERVLDNELGWRWNNNNWNINANLYYMDFKNEIVLAGNYGPNAYPLTSNVDKSYRMGLETSIGYKINQHWQLLNNSAFSKNEIKDDNITFSPILTPSIVINQSVIYSYRNFSIDLNARYQSKSYLDFANEFTIDPYFVLNARLSYQYKKLGFNLMLNNITNADYYNNGYVSDQKMYLNVQAPFNTYFALKYTL